MLHGYLGSLQQMTFVDAGVSLDKGAEPKACGRRNGFVEPFGGMLT